MSKMTVLLFASLQEKAGTGEISIEIEEPSSVEQIYDRLIHCFPDLERYRPVVRVAVNRKFASWSKEVSAGDEVAFFPPVSGG